MQKELTCVAHRLNGNLNPMSKVLLNARIRLRVTCFLFLVTFLSGCSAVGSTKPAALQITSTPEAAVFLDGKHLGKTPFYSDQLKAGEYTLKISAQEASFVEKINLLQAALTVVNRELNKNFMGQSGETLWLEPGKKGLFISSMPNEADVAIDGKPSGTTPLLIEKVDVGDHKVTLSKKGYITHEFSIKASDKSQLMADVTLASEIVKAGNLPSPSPVLTQKVQISNTPQGFLRVRKDASLSSPEIGRVKPTEKYELIQETVDWFKISFESPPAGEAGKQGWISSQFAKKI